MSTDSSRRIPSGITAAAVLGAVGGAVAWFAATGWSHLVSGYVRLDQLTMLTLGAIVGAATLGGDALRRRQPVGAPVMTGFIVGGVSALVVATIVALLSPTGNSAFLVERAAGWCCVVTVSAAALATTYGSPGRALMRATVAIALVGGTACGLVVLLPGAAEFWSAIAFTVAGATIAVAVTSPRLWRAVAIVEHAPARNAIPALLALREWTINDGEVVALGTAQLSCTNGRVALHPPAGGATVNGLLKTKGIFVMTSCVVAVSGQRYLVQVRNTVP